LGAEKTRSQKNACAKRGGESHLPKRSEGVRALLGNHEPTKTLANWGFMFFDD
jgi:hypothetical protein